MTEAIAKKEPVTLAENMEKALIMGDLSGLKPEERLSYYKAVCLSVGLNPLTKPFEFITLNGKLTLYVKREATEQLRKIHGVSIVELEDSTVQDVHVVKAKAQDKTGRTDWSKGAVAIGNLKGVDLANSLMKAETKAKRRVTLSICGLGMLDESEIEDAQVGTFHNQEQTLPPEPNMDVKCAACSQVNGHAADCPTRQPKAAAPKATKTKAEPKPEPEAPKQAEGKVIEPESKDKKYVAFFYVESVKDGQTKTKTKYQTLLGNVRGNTEKIQVHIFHKSLMENSGLLKGNWAEIEVSGKPSAKDPAVTLYSLENIIGVEDSEGYTPWKDGKPAPSDDSEHGVPASEVFDTP